MIKDKIHVSFHRYRSTLQGLGNTFEIISWITKYSDSYIWTGIEIFGDIPTGVYLNKEDAIIFKLMFGL
jgi:hypothetical protein